MCIRDSAKFHPADQERVDQPPEAGSLEEETLSPDAPFNKTYGTGKLVDQTRDQRPAEETFARPKR